MRLALVATLLPSDVRGGAEAYVDASARSLAEHHDVVVLTGSRKGRVDGVPTIRLPRLPLLDPRMPVPVRVLWHAFDQWLPHVHVTLARALRRLSPDMVVTHHPQGLSAAVFTAIAQIGLPHVHVAHDLNLLCARMTMTKDGEFCGGRCASCLVQRRIRGTALRMNVARLIGVSRYVRDRHVAAGVVPSEKAVAIRLGAEPGGSRVRRNCGGGLRLGFIGTLGAHKGVPTLLDAFRRTRDASQLVIAGAGELEKDVRTAARTDPRITYVGHVSAQRKDSFFDELDLVVIPSEWEEPATLVAMEAAVRGIPAVVSDRGGLPETPEARIFRARDPDALLRAVSWFAEDPNRLEQASRRLLESRSEFEWSTHMERFENVLHDVLGAAKLQSAAV
jgi:glycosyltransferase involved in cell wall biosynthesis